VTHGPPSAADAREVDADNALAAGGAHRPAAVALEPDGVLRYEHPPSTTWPRANAGPMLRERGGRAGHSQRNRVAQRAPVTGGFQAQRIGIGKAVAAIQLEGDPVKGAAVVDRSPRPPWGR